jgi:hypothetical protein
MPEKLDQHIGVIADGLCWMTVLGCIQLALRHPQYTGPVSDIAKQFAEQLAAKLLLEGVLSENEMAMMLRDEMIARNTGKRD